MTSGMVPSAPTADVVAEEPLPEGSDLANREAKAIANLTLEREARRHEARQTHLHFGAIILFWAALATILGMGFVWIFHLIAPATWCWLPVEQQNRLQSILISALGSSVVTHVSRRWIANDKT